MSTAVEPTNLLEDAALIVDVCFSVEEERRRDDHLRRRDRADEARRRRA